MTDEAKIKRWAEEIEDLAQHIQEELGSTPEPPEPPTPGTPLKIDGRRILKDGEWWIPIGFTEVKAFAIQKTDHNWSIEKYIAKLKSTGLDFTTAWCDIHADGRTTEPDVYKHLRWPWKETDNGFQLDARHGWDSEWTVRLASFLASMEAKRKVTLLFLFNDWWGKNDRNKETSPWNKKNADVDGYNVTDPAKSLLGKPTDLQKHHVNHILDIVQPFKYVILADVNEGGSRKWKKAFHPWLREAMRIRGMNLPIASMAGYGGFESGENDIILFHSSGSTNVDDYRKIINGLWKHEKPMIHEENYGGSANKLLAVADYLASKGVGICRYDWGWKRGSNPVHYFDRLKRVNEKYNG